MYVDYVDSSIERHSDRSDRSSMKSYSNHPHCSDAIKNDLTPICGSGLDVESRNDVSRSMARDSSSNEIFLVSFQMLFYVLEAFLPSLCLPVGMVV